MKPLEVKLGGIKYDNNNYNFMDTSVKVQDYDKWSNKPCLKCVEKLLTEDNCKNVQFLS